MSPISKSISVLEELGSPFISLSFFLEGSNFSCVNSLILTVEFSLIVETVPFDIKRMTFPSAPVLTV